MPKPHVWLSSRYVSIRVDIIGSLLSHPFSPSSHVVFAPRNATHATTAQFVPNHHPGVNLTDERSARQMDAHNLKTMLPVASS